MDVLALITDEFIGGMREILKRHKPPAIENTIETIRAKYNGCKTEDDQQKFRAELFWMIEKSEVRIQLLRKIGDKPTCKAIINAAPPHNKEWIKYIETHLRELSLWTDPGTQ